MTFNTNEICHFILFHYSSLIKIRLLLALYMNLELRAMYHNPELRAMYHNSQHFSISASTITHSCLECCATLQHLLDPQQLGKPLH